MARRRGDIYDEWLVLRCQEGEMRALEELTGRWQGRLWRYAVGQLGDREAGLDVVQEGWLAIVKGIGRLKDPATFRSWAYQIMANKCADRIRTQVRGRRQHIEAIAIAESRGAEAGGRGRSGVDEITELRRAMTELTPENRGLLHLRYVEAMSVPMIANVLGLAEGTVKSRLHAMRKELKDVLESRTTADSSESVKGVDCDDGQ